LFESTVQMTDSYYSTQLPASEVAELVDHTSVTACNKQTDRWRAPIPLLRAGRGGRHTAGVLMLSAVDGRLSGRRRAWTWTTGRPCIQSVCNRTPATEMRVRGGAYAVMWSEMH